MPTKVFTTINDSMKIRLTALICNESMWKCIVLSLLRIIWIERNNRIFEDKVMSNEDLFEKAKYLASLWTSTENFQRISFFFGVNQTRNTSLHLWDIVLSGRDAYQQLHTSLKKSFCQRGQIRRNKWNERTMQLTD